MDGFAGAIGVSDSDGKASPVVHCYRPREGTDPRYYAYLLRDLALRGFVSSLAKGIRERSTAFDAEMFRSLVLPRPGPAEQRAIADYLDTETARIDALIARKRRMIELLEERLGVAIEHEFNVLRDRCSIGPIVALCSLVLDCVNKTAPTVDEETGYRMIRTSNVRAGRVLLDDLYNVDEATYRTWTRRGRPRRGDVLLTREAPVGEVGVLDTDDPVFLGQRLMMYRATEGISDPSYLAFALRSGQVQKQMKLLGSGSLHEHLRVGDCSKFRVPLAPLEEQRTVVERIERTRSTCEGAAKLLTRQLELLLEHRRALVTTAVMGELAVAELAA